MSFSIPEPLARAMAKVPEPLVTGVIELVTRIVSAPKPLDALARALQVTAHEQAADAALDAAFAAKNRVVGTGE